MTAPLPDPLTKTLAITRRTFIAGALLTPLFRFLRLGGNPAEAATASAGLEFGPARSFSWAALCEHARQLARQPYPSPRVHDANELPLIDYDAHHKIRYRSESALWAQGDGPYPVQFFHLANAFKEPVKLYRVHQGVAREILYSPRLFDFSQVPFAANLPPDLGFAGFRVMHSRAQESDWLAFLGASYFRSAGELNQYGLSARGIAIDTALPAPEEFPRFTSFWLAPAADSRALVIYALLDGPSITGAYRFEVATGGGVTTEVTAVLFTRTAIRRLGVAPLTSMYWFSETNRAQGQDWRPEVHDSDGLVLWTGTGERLWRPVNNPPVVRTSSFLDVNPKGFGLFQRDRNFENYQDDHVFYERRPSLWVEPLEPWGKGSVQLIEIPTQLETEDNIVVYWLPEAPVPAGSTWRFHYRLHWLSDEPYPPELGRVVATRLKWDEVWIQSPPVKRAKLVIDFAGGPLAQIAKNAAVKLIVSAAGAPHGKLVSSSVFPLLETQRWRGVFEIDMEEQKPFDLRAYLRLNDRALTETWLYQLIPPSASC